MDGRAESIFEGLLRLLHVVCGIEVEPQYRIVDQSGCFVARADLLVVGTTTAHELDGGHHRSPEQQQSDLRRHRRMMAAGYERRGFTSDDVLTAPIGIVRDAYASWGVEHDPAVIRAWYLLVQESLFTAAGRRRLELRLGFGAGNRG